MQYSVDAVVISAPADSGRGKPAESVCHVS